MKTKRLPKQQVFPIFIDDGEFDPLVAARCILKDPRRFQEGALDGYRLDQLQQEAVMAELSTMAQLAREALMPGDPDREAILFACDAASGKLPAIPAGR
jgi:hypothetical protein